MSAARATLLGMLKRDSDMELIFDDDDEALPGHSLILGLWSTVMRAAIDADSSKNTGKIRVPMTGTSKEDWLLAMEFLYPVIPPPEVDWDNLETLLEVADKYVMSSLLQRVGTFLTKRDRESFDFDSDSERFIWKWIIAADRYGLVDVAKQCISQEVQLHELVESWPEREGFDYSGHQLSAQLLEVLSYARELHTAHTAMNTMFKLKTAVMGSILAPHVKTKSSLCSSWQGLQAGHQHRSQLPVATDVNAL